MKRLVSIWLILSLLFAPTTAGMAFNENEHNSHLIRMLFGGENPSLTEEQQKDLDALTSAVYLALDQFNGHGEDKLGYLAKSYGVRQILKTLTEIDFDGNQYHRTYTHRGWNHFYPIDKANWAKRKETLLKTTEKVFDFSIVSGKIFGVDLGYSRKCESFAALMYYAHVLEDYEAQTTYKNNVMIPFAHPNPSDDNPDLLYEMIKHLTVLFADQKHTYTYKSLMIELQMIAEEARKIAGTTGGVNTDEKFKKYHQSVLDCTDVLNDYIYKLLKNENFWKKVFE